MFKVQSQPIEHRLATSGLTLALLAALGHDSTAAPQIVEIVLNITSDLCAALLGSDLDFAAFFDGESCDPGGCLDGRTIGCKSNDNSGLLSHQSLAELSSFWFKQVVKESKKQ